uniref:Uncharacterized protein n=1 Tax=Anopheles quadriannulatus TaxID=34691 RepID=A0A182XQ48_ANOQN
MQSCTRPYCDVWEAAKLHSDSPQSSGSGKRMFVLSRLQSCSSGGRGFMQPRSLISLTIILHS